MIVFPAAILQTPYFYNNADDALKYGGMGMVIGHEITHAFDEEGTQFDKDDNVKNWWTEDDYTKFKYELLINCFSMSRYPKKARVAITAQRLPLLH